MTTFIIDYLSGLTNYVFNESVLKRIAYDRDVADVTSISELEQKQKDLLLADLYYVIYYSPYMTASISNSHGSFKQVVGAQMITNKDEIYKIMCHLYKKYGDEKLNLISLTSGSVSWINEED